MLQAEGAEWGYGEEEGRPLVSQGQQVWALVAPAGILCPGTWPSAPGSLTDPLAKSVKQK